MEWSAAINAGLDMSPDSRMARAVDMGFITNLDNLINKGLSNEQRKTENSRSDKKGKDSGQVQGGN